MIILQIASFSTKARNECKFACFNFLTHRLLRRSYTAHHNDRFGDTIDLRNESKFRKF